MAEEKRIEIEPGGPYVVHGDIPIREMSPVHTFNGEPVDWHTLRDLGAGPGPVRLCRCGHSNNKPFCDDSHEFTDWDGTQTAERSTYRSRAETQEHGGETLADDLPLCIEAGFCKTRTTSVWKIFDESDDPARRKVIREMVDHCPSGRIALFRANGEPAENALPPEIGVTPGGPLWVRGGIPIIGQDGLPWEPRNRATLCRCGGSANKPYCDATHLDMHFDER